MTNHRGPKGPHKEHEMTITRKEIIAALRNTSESYSNRICNRLQNCGVRIVRRDGSTEQSTEMLTRLQALYAMIGDETIERIECLYNQKWELVA